MSDFYINSFRRPLQTWCTKTGLCFVHLFRVRPGWLCNLSYAKKQGKSAADEEGDENAAEGLFSIDFPRIPGL